MSNPFSGATSIRLEFVVLKRTTRFLKSYSLAGCLLDCEALSKGVALYSILRQSKQIFSVTALVEIILPRDANIHGVLSEDGQ